MTSSDPVEILYLSLPSYSVEEGTLFFNLSKRVPLADKQHRPVSLSDDLKLLAVILQYWSTFALMISALSFSLNVVLNLDDIPLPRGKEEWQGC